MSGNRPGKARATGKPQADGESGWIEVRNRIRQNCSRWALTGQEHYGTNHINHYCSNRRALMKIKILFKLVFPAICIAGFCQAQGAIWVGTWGSSPQLTEPRNLPPPPGLTSNTLRQIVQVSIGGEKLRARFSNAFGTNPVTMDSVHLAQWAGGGRIRTNTDRALAFDGKPAVTIPAGESVISDPFN